MRMVMVLFAMVMLAWGFARCNPGNVLEEKGTAGCEKDGFVKGTQEFEDCMQQKGLRMDRTKREVMENLQDTQSKLDAYKAERAKGMNIVKP